MKNKKTKISESAEAFIRRTGGSRGAALTSAAQFGCVVNLSHPAFTPGYVEECARSVMDGDYDSIAPSSGTDVFYVTKRGKTTIATTRFQDGELKKYKLIA